jgi:hypothetical protein
MFARLAEENAPLVYFEINDHAYKKGYYLVNGIYPQYVISVNTF